jgi:predicted  nucleic acid-binding Zn-ribbon protein
MCQKIYQQKNNTTIYKGDTMTNEELLQKVLNNTIERIGRQAIAYEAEIANLSSQITILNSQIEEINDSKKEKPAKAAPVKDS